MSATSKAEYEHAATGSSAGEGIAAMMRAALARNWWVVALRGALAVGFGLITMLFPGITLLVLVIAFASYMIIDGGFAIVSAYRAARKHERWGLIALTGLLNIAAGVVALLWPGITVLAFAIILGAWALVSGGLTIAAARQLDDDHGRWWFVLSGIASALLGIALLVAPPVGALVLTIWLGAYAFVFGLFLIIFAFRLRSQAADTTTSPPPASAQP
jgi:uncharacterized membrane protein HdeD (DUF308 family)